VRSEREITCIVCPIGCKILVKSDGKKVGVLSGHKCKKGVDYVVNEALDPRRMLTSSVFVENGKWPLVSVKSFKSVPKDKIFDVLEEIKKTVVKAPVRSGQVVIKNVAGTGIGIVATKTVEKL
jgi:CxxC motif-containing protein